MRPNSLPHDHVFILYLLYLLCLLYFSLNTDFFFVYCTLLTGKNPYKTDIVFTFSYYLKFDVFVMRTEGVNESSLMTRLRLISTGWLKECTGHQKLFYSAHPFCWSWLFKAVLSPRRWLLGVSSCSWEEGNVIVQVPSFTSIAASH